MPSFARSALPTPLIILLLAIATTAVAAAPNRLTPQELDEGWILLFDGATLFGWQAASKADWKVAEGAIGVSEGEPGLLVTTSQFANYALKADFRAAKGTNSGIFLRTPATPTLADLTERCYELNISGPENAFPTGSLVRRQKAAAEAVAETPDWRSFEVTADGGHITVQLDGKRVLDYTDPKPVARGLIGLQLNQGKVEFRNIKLKPLGLKSLFNGKDLAGWKIHADNKSQWKVTPEGWLHVANGKGQLESEPQFADFTLQLDVFVNGSGLNSGVFFRSIPGQWWNGYESQIQNAFKDGDRTKPVDCGTGGIFRRQNARQVVANDREWFHKTIHADGPHMAVWVNGYQVSDWIDKRPADENPRKGLRLQAGTLILQGHDPTTDFSFRNLRAAEMPK